MPAIRLALVGLGKIARDQHVPAIGAATDFELVAAADPAGALAGLPCYADLDALLRSVPDVAAVALCTPPQARFGIARRALQAGLHVLLEKPPCVTVSEAQALVALAQQRNLALFASWHSRHARGVAAARAWLQDRPIRSATVAWKEDVRVWHPGQAWIWRAGGLGVFDPGINALSILTHIIPGALALADAELSFPGNCATPSAAQLELCTAAGATVRAHFDFLHAGAPTWDIEVATDAGLLCLTQGGRDLALDGRVIETAERHEYPDVYAHFAALVRSRRVDVDLAPLQLAADATLRGRRRAVADFTE
jgi:predicted dehydrogenase